MVNNNSKCLDGLLLPILDETHWHPITRGTLYLIALLYTFIGVSIITDIFMGSVMVITSRTKKVYLTIAAEEDYLKAPDFIEVKVWNGTVASLTLMALGTSSPEIFLACIEIIFQNFEAGELRPGTIIGSAAFNLFIITAVCILCVPKGETRKIEMYAVFFVSSIFSVLAYIWVWLVSSKISPGVIEVWEAALTLLLFPALILTAYMTDRKFFGFRFFRKYRKASLVMIDREIKSESGPLQTKPELLEQHYFLSGRLDKTNMSEYVNLIKKYPSVKSDDAAFSTALRVMHGPTHSLGFYKLNALRKMRAAKGLRPSIPLKLQDLYHVVMNITPSANSDEPDVTVIELKYPKFSVRVDVGSFPVIIFRHGNLSNFNKVQVRTINGSAKAGIAYVKLNEVVTFAPRETKKQVHIKIIHRKDDIPEQEFFVQMTPLDKNKILLGTNMMVVTITNSDKLSSITFEKRGVIVKDDVEEVCLKVLREFVIDTYISVQWQTIPLSAMPDRDYVHSQGTLTFSERQIVQFVTVPIIKDSRPEKKECFIVELFDPSENATLGTYKETYVTVTNDEAFINIMDKIVKLAKSNAQKAGTGKIWINQIKDSMSVNGGDSGDHSLTDYFIHFLSFLWKVVFSLVPPACLLDGWLCFFISLILIGVVTAVMGDIASIFGCIVGVKNSVVAVTFVAVGSSLPDTFSSRMAALRDTNADASIGNITGSNSFNVFLGLGLPWFLATLYHYCKGSSFKISEKALGVEVFIFTIMEILAMLLLVLRRYTVFLGHAELGGPIAGKWLSSLFLLILWVLYITFVILIEYDVTNFCCSSKD